MTRSVRTREPKERFFTMQEHEESIPAVAETRSGGGRRRWNRQELGRQASKTAREVLESTRRAAESGLDAAKTRAASEDRVGVATHRALELASGGLDAAGRALSQLGQVTRPSTPGASVPATRSPKSGRRSEPKTS
jgi:hypothetical protein